MRPWAQLKHILLCTCHAAAEISSRRLDERLPWSDRLALWGHVLVCHSCRHFLRQLSFMRRSLRTMAESLEATAATSEEASLSTEARERIARRLREAAPQ